MGAGPERFDWRAPTYDTFEISALLLPGGAPNQLVVLAHNYDTCGGAAAPGNMPEVCKVADPSFWWLDTPSGRFMNHVPGLALAIMDGVSGAVVFASGASAAWRTSNATRYRPSRAVWASVPDSIDGRVDGGDAAWLRAGFDDSAWQPAMAVDGSQWGPLRARGVPRLRLAPVTLAPAAPLPLVLSDTRPSVVLDAGMQALASYSVALAAASAPGLVLSLTWYERRNATTGALSHSYTTSTYTTAGAAAGESFETADVFGGRYVLVALAAGSASGAGPFSATLVSVNATDARYPFELVASFDAPAEPFFARLFGMAAATLSVNAADAFTDCSTRERAEWLGDAVINEHNGTRLAFATVEDDGSTSYADTRLLRGVLKRAALSSRSFYPTAFQIRAHTASDRLDFNGVWSTFSVLLLIFCTPDPPASNSPCSPCPSLRSGDYGMAAITGLARLVATTGDEGAAFARSTWADWRAGLLWVAGRVQLGSGLGLFRETVFFTDELFLDITCGVTMNAFAFAALSDGAALAAELGFAADAQNFAGAAAALRAALIARAFNESEGAFAAGVPADSAAFPDLFWSPDANASALAPSPLPNYVALAKGVLDADPARAARVAQWLLRRDLISAAGAPMTAIQLLAALYAHGNSSQADKAALDVVRANWAQMVAADDVGTLWEFFDESGEVAHNMGAAPLPFLLERVLGVTTTLPLSPVRRRVSLEPHLGDLATARGVAVSEFGPVGVAWALVGGSWGSAGARSVALELNASVAVALPPPARSPGLRGAASPDAAAVVVLVSLPLSDAAEPPPADPAAALAPYCLARGGAATLNVTEGLASGELSLDADRRYLRFEWSVATLGANEERELGERPPSWLGGPPLRGLAAVASLSVLLSAPVGGC